MAEIIDAYLRLAPQVRRNDLRAMVAVARRGARRTRRAEEQQATAIRLGYMVRQVLAVLPMDARCLIRSLVLLRLLESRGIAGRLVIGVQNETGFSAHAWVEHDDVAVLPTEQMTPLTYL